MLGLPSGGAERMDFFASFWPSLYAGVISSIITGIIVGIILIVWQKNLDKQTNKQMYKREVSILKERLKLDLIIPEVFTITNALDSIPKRAKALAEAITDSPVSLWKANLKKERELLESLIDFQNSLADFRSRAINLDHYLEQFSREFNSKRGAISANDPIIISYILGKLEEFSSKELARWLPLSETNIPQWVNEAYTEAVKSDDLGLVHKEYSSARVKLDERVSKVVDVLN